MPAQPKDTRSVEYAQRLDRVQGAAWKRILQVQAPYRWNLRRLRPGRTIDVGCGIGRNLMALGAGSVGVDHNEAAVAACRRLGLEAYGPEEFAERSSAQSGAFDTLLLAHVVEHMTLEAAIACVDTYARYLRPDSKVILITPQEAGFASDPTHVSFMGYEQLAAILERCGFVPRRRYSFPFPRWAGKYFRYNEFVMVGIRPPAG